ncbi:MAG: carboxypeptidase regulatory-like domain-containing protein [Gemmatimonadota bacterium]|nr:carboxypeptidase regulatory-like domain-containing protein [Gemmatimonadota bacterium]
MCNGFLWRGRLALWSVPFLLGTALLQSAADAQQRPGAVRGVVLDSLGGAVSFAQVGMEGVNSQVVTDAEGAFRFAAVPAGEVRFLVRRLGYRPGSFAVQVQPASEASVEFRLAALAGLLPTVEVRRRVEVSDARLAGYNARREKRVGHFITRDYLDRHDSPRFADVLRQVAGVRVRPMRGGGTTVSMRGNCAPLVFLDGFPAAAGTLDLNIIDLASVEGIEVYSGIATIPAEFASVRGGERCGVIVVWSRPARPRTRRLSRGKAEHLEREVASSSVYTASQVDQAVILAPGTAEPIYPDTLWRANVSGRVVAEFIVDQRGSIEPATFRVVSTTHRYFSASVTAALEGAVFRAASLAGRKVRQFVQVPFIFEASGGTPRDGLERF